MRFDVDKFIWPLGRQRGRYREEFARVRMMGFDSTLIMHRHAVKTLHQRAVILCKSVEPHFGRFAPTGGILKPPPRPIYEPALLVRPSRQLRALHLGL